LTKDPHRHRRRVSRGCSAGAGHHYQEGHGQCCPPRGHRAGRPAPWSATAHLPPARPWRRGRDAGRMAAV